MDVHAVDLGDELRQRVQPRLDAPEVVVRRPVARQLLNRRQLHALRPISDELFAGPARPRNASTEVVQGLVRNLNLEGVHVDAGLNGATHEATSLRVGWGFGLTSFLVREPLRHYSPTVGLNKRPHQIDTTAARANVVGERSTP